jgi:hypothetical protein
MKIDEEGWLVPEEGDPKVVRFATVRTYRLVVPAPLGIVWHWTSGRGGTGFAERLARRVQTYRRGVDRPASWHVLIARDGVIYQSAPLLVGTWHVGRPGVIAGQRFDNINRATIGCELENAGRLRKIGERFYCWPFWTNPGAPAYERRPDPRCAIDAARATVVQGQGIFDAYSREQQLSVAAMLSALVARFSWTREACSYGHRDFDPKRKEDPGPVWADSVLPQILNQVFGGRVPAAAQSAPPAAHGG